MVEAGVDETSHSICVGVKREKTPESSRILHNDGFG